MAEKLLFVLKIIGTFVFFPLILAWWLISSMINQIRRMRDRELVEKPLGQYVQVDGHRMSVLVTGQGEHTIVFLPGLWRTCPILDFKPLFSRLEDEYRIVVPEKFGYGQSDIVKENRDFETIVEQYREALSILGIEPPYILCAHSLSGHDVQLWEQKYPEEVEAFIGLDANIANCLEIEFNYKYLWWEDRFLERVYAITGYCRTADLYGLDKALSKEEVRVIRELEVRNNGNYDCYSEEKNYLAAHKLINSRPLPTHPTLQFVDTPEWYQDGDIKPHEKGEWDDYEITWVRVHQEYVDYVAAVNPAKIIHRSTGHVMHHYDYVEMAAEIKEFLNEVFA